jgi:hypothetical protein
LFCLRDPRGGKIEYGILGKSNKELSVTLKGTIKGKDQKVEVTFKKDSVEVDYVPRVTRVLEKGTARLIVSSNRVEEELARVTRDFARKHIRLTVASETSIPKSRTRPHHSYERSANLGRRSEGGLLSGFRFSWRLVPG